MPAQLLEGYHTTAAGIKGGSSIREAVAKMLNKDRGEDLTLLMQVQKRRMAMH